MNFSFDVDEDTEVFKASIMSSQGPKTMVMGSSPLSDDGVSISDFEDPNTALALIFPTIVAKLDPLETPTTLHVLKGLGEGTMGQVFLTRDSNTSRVFALKVFNKNYVLACEELENTVTERGCLMETGDNPFVVHLHSSFQDDTRFYMLLDFCAGGDLATELTRCAGGMPMESVMYNAAHLLEGIASLHALGIIHRDLKPENILLTVRGHIKISDFGSAVRVSSPESWVEPTTQFGTVAYTPPEVFSGRHDCFIDWWCLGVILYEMILGKHPFLPGATHGEGVDIEEVQESICNGEYSFPEEMHPSIRRIIRGFLRINPKRRWGASEARDSSFFSGWDWESVRQLQYEPPRPPVIHAQDAMSNFDPEFTHMSLELEDVSDDDDDILDGAPVPKSFDRSATAVDDPHSSPAGKLSPLQTQASHISWAHTDLYSGSNAAQLSRFHQILGEDVTTCSLLLPRSRACSVSPDRPNIPISDGVCAGPHRNAWRNLKICLAAVTRFKRGNKTSGQLLEEEGNTI